MGLPEQHSSLGDRLPWLCLALLVVSALWFWMQRPSARPDQRAGIRRGLGLLSVILAAGSIALTVAVGHTGALAVWEGRIPSSDPGATVTSTPTAGPSSAPSGSRLTMADVANHSTSADCWAVVNGTVYDLTTWIGQHPGGAAVIEAICGTDATSAFEAQHEGQAEPSAELQGFEIGLLS